ncbi:hypothetical protein GJ496_009855 [Pomphorhynchus laevis]|nr:hypothetical protein GJ496_009855 [Pomphorhynchus laevis]
MRCSISSGAQAVNIYVDPFVDLGKRPLKSIDMRYIGRKAWNRTAHLLSNMVGFDCGGSSTDKGLNDITEATLPLVSNYSDSDL